MRQIIRIGCVAAIVATSTVGITGCSYLKYLPFLKRAVDLSPRGSSSTHRGPAFQASSGTRVAVDVATDWASYNNTLSGARYSPLAQITTRNVAELRPLCTFQTGEQAAMQSGPVVVHGTMYITSAVATYALDATTCQLRWKHTYRYSPKPDYDLAVNRGVAYLDTPDGPRLVRGANDGRVYALDATTGEEVWNVLAGDVAKGETFPAAPVAARGLVYIGNAGGDNYAVTGRMMAFDARTGARVWSFDLVPRAGTASASWPAETNRIPRAGGTTWTSYTIDTAAGLIYIPTGNAAPDFLTDVRAGEDLYTYSVVVLDMRTGAFRRAYQLLHRDAHDWDVAAAPVLITTARGRRDDPLALRIIIATGGWCHRNRWRPHFHRGSERKSAGLRCA